MVNFLKLRYERFFFSKNCMWTIYNQDKPQTTMRQTFNRKQNNKHKYKTLYTNTSFMRLENDDRAQTWYLCIREQMICVQQDYTQTPSFFWSYARDWIYIGLHLESASCGTFVFILFLRTIFAGSQFVPIGFHLYIHAVCLSYLVRPHVCFVYIIYWFVLGFPLFALSLFLPDSCLPSVCSSSPLA